MDKIKCSSLYVYPRTVNKTPQEVGHCRSVLGFPQEVGHCRSILGFAQEVGYCWSILGSPHQEVGHCRSIPQEISHCLRLL